VLVDECFVTETVLAPPLGCGNVRGEGGSQGRDSEGGHSLEKFCQSYHMFKCGFLVHGQVTIIFVVSVGLSVCLLVQSFSQPSLIRF